MTFLKEYADDSSKELIFTLLIKVEINNMHLQVEVLPIEGVL